MNAQEIKEYLYNNQKVETLLEHIGCQHIKWHSSGYWTAGNPPPADNKQAITIYAPNLNVINYTRDLSIPSDIFTLVQFYKELNFFQALKYICELFEINPYLVDANLPESLRITKELKAMNSGNCHEEDIPIKPISENILTYYQTPCVNDMFLRDGISYETQKIFEIGYDSFTNRITIPIRDETSILCGVKGRLFKDKLDEDDLKYLYIEPCPRQKILYGYHLTYPYIKEKNWAWVTEAEKGVLQLWSYGYKNAVATGGEKVSKTQIEKLSRLAVPICIAFDKDVSEEKVQHMANQFIDGIEIWAMFDRDNILGEKESPSDNCQKFEKLAKDNIYRIK